VGLCNGAALCCPQCGSSGCCKAYRSTMPTTIYASIIAGRDAGTKVTLHWNAALGIYVGQWQSSCGQLMQMCISCDNFGLKPPGLSCPNTCSNPCCGGTVDGTIGSSCGPPISAEYVLTIPAGGNSCYPDDPLRHPGPNCPAPCAGDSSWTVVLSE
jgi:hypothetical protein